MLQEKDTMRKMGSITSGGGRALYIDREKRKRRKRIVNKLIVWAILIAIVCLVIFGSKMLFGLIADTFNEDFSFSFNTPQSWQDYDSITEIKKDYAIGIAYPLINEKTDKTIRKDTQKMLDEFKDEIKQFKTGKGENRAIYTTDFSITKNSDIYVSVVYSVHRSNPLREIDDIQYRTKIYDISSGKEVTAEDIFNEGYATTVSDYIISFFENSSQYSPETGTTLFKENTKPEPDNFSKISFSEKAMTVYFSAGEIFPSDINAVTASIPLSKIHTYMKLNISGYTPPLYDPDKPMVALTFDDGPHKPSSSRILDALEKANARATFFILGERVANEKATIIRGNELGCEYGNHTWDHTNLSTLTAEEIAEQINKTDEALESVIGMKSSLLRAPYAAVNDTVSQTAGKPFIGWSIDTEDWQNNDIQHVKDAVLNNIKDGDIVLMHDLYSSTATAAEQIIEELTQRGFQIVTVSELMEARNITLVPGKVHYSAKRKN